MKQVYLPDVLGNVKSREEVMREIKDDEVTYSIFSGLNYE